MKKTISLTLAAISLLSLVSCQKDNPTPDNQKASRIVTAVFEATATKTTIFTDDVTPLWSVGDKIRIIDETNFEDIMLLSENILDDGKKITFVTSLTGASLYAVYPALATSLTSYDGTGDFTVVVPSCQDGTFGSANICVAKGDDADNLTFSNVTSVLEFTQDAAATGVKKVLIRAANAIAGPLTVSFGSDGKVDSYTESALTNKAIVAESSEPKDKYYIAVAPVTTGKVEFKYTKDIMNVATYIDESGKDLAPNKIYGGTNLSMDYKTYGHDFVVLAGKKWATANIGASDETKYGHYFSWGNIIGYVRSGASWVVAEGYTGAGNEFSGGFSEGNYNSTPGHSLSGNIPIDVDYDAARANWGGNWRLPTEEELCDIATQCFLEWSSNGLYVWAAKGSDAGYLNYKGTMKKYNSSLDSYSNDAAHTAETYDPVEDIYAFFPATGYGTGTDFFSGGEYCNYWSSTMSSSSEVYSTYYTKWDGYKMGFKSGRHFGYPIRPVSDL